MAKALIALENHGGGFLLIGYREGSDKRLEPDPNRPADLSSFGSDSLNAILRRRAEPAFNVEVNFQRHPESGEDYPLVRVSGLSGVPVRSASSTPNGALKDFTYYIRAPGPESRAPLYAHEWDALIRRSILNQRDEILQILRTFLPALQGHAVGNVDPQLPADVSLGTFTTNALEEWIGLNSSLEKDHRAKIVDGFFYFSARIVGASVSLPLAEVVNAVESARRYTGWPVYIVVRREGLEPQNIDGFIQAWVARNSLGDPGHADFWRIGKEGLFFLLRGYQEDAAHELRGGGPSGSALEVTLPVWRVGEFVLRTREIAQKMFDGDFMLHVECTWTGLKGRRLYAHRFDRLVPGYAAGSDVVHTSAAFDESDVDRDLPRIVEELTASLYENFEFYRPQSDFYRDELSRLTNRPL